MSPQTMVQPYKPGIKLPGVSLHNENLHSTTNTPHCTHTHHAFVLRLRLRGPESAGGSAAVAGATPPGCRTAAAMGCRCCTVEVLPGRLTVLRLRAAGAG